MRNKPTNACGMWLLCIAGALALPAAAQARPGPACPAPGGGQARWVGLGLLAGGKGYAVTPMGQVHYRLAGPPRGPVLLLLHQTPWSMIEYAEIQACLAARGIRSLAIDTPGYGLSDPPPGAPSVAGYADNLVPVLDALGIRRVVVAGHHTGAAIAAAFAARHGDRVLGLLMHGTPLYTAEERAARLAAPERPRALSPDGAHLSDYYRAIRAYAGSDPRTMATASWSVFAWYQAGANDVAHKAVFENDLAADLARVSAPVLILSDARDSLHASDLRAVREYPRFGYRQFSDGGAHALMLDPRRWAELAGGFVAQVAGGTRAGPARPR